MTARTHAQVGASNRRRGKDTERKVATYLEAHGLGDGRRNLAGYARDHGDIGPVTDRDGDLWAVEVKGWQDPTPGKVEAAAREAAREAEHAAVPLWVLVVRRPGCADVGRWWAWVTSHTAAVLHATDDARLAGTYAAHPDDLVCLTLRAWVALVAPDQEATP